MFRFRVRTDTLPQRVSNPDQQGGERSPSSVGHVQNREYPDQALLCMRFGGQALEGPATITLGPGDTPALTLWHRWTYFLGHPPCKSSPSQDLTTWKSWGHLLQAAPTSTLSTALDDSYHGPLWSSMLLLPKSPPKF